MTKTGLAIAFRADGSSRIGTGHIMRCLTLAAQLRSSVKSISFVIRLFPGEMSDFIRQQGFDVFGIKGGPEPRPDTIWSAEEIAFDASATQGILRDIEAGCLIVDHYGLDVRWEREMKKLVSKRLVIDDLANRPHDCELLLDQNFSTAPANRYDRLVPKGCQVLLGPKYVLLRPEFFEARKRLRARDGSIRRVLVFFGGADPTNETAKAVDALAGFGSQFKVDVVVGGSNPRREEIRAVCARKGMEFHCQTERMAQLMSEADLSIGAGGTSVWERCCLGLPSIIVVAAPNQETGSAALARIGACVTLGSAANVAADTIARAVKDLLLHPEKAARIAKVGFDLMAEAERERARGGIARYLVGSTPS